LSPFTTIIQYYLHTEIRHAFPTRRSSDLRTARELRVARDQPQHDRYVLPVRARIPAGNPLDDARVVLLRRRNRPPEQHRRDPQGPPRRTGEPRPDLHARGRGPRAVRAQRVQPEPHGPGLRAAVREDRGILPAGDPGGDE